MESLWLELIMYTTHFELANLVFQSEVLRESFDLTESLIVLCRPVRKLSVI